MDLSKLGRTEQVISAVGLLLFVFSFLPWYSISYLGLSWSADAWSDPSGFLDWFPVLLLLAYGVILALPAFGVALDIPTLAGAVNRAFIGLALSAFAVLLFAIQGLTYPSADGYGGPSWAYFVALVLALAAGAQSYLGFTRQGGSFAQVSEGFKARTQGAAPAQQVPAQQQYEQQPYQQPEEQGQQPPAPPV
ncbi:hypothetical protein KDK95_15735 [Actinospica sp. MGRD01-02]|uniref:Uncharacterized protein n=1 Tax=Actinospica acidithermotolerans TaxID=2828514 RepID=A0A941ECC8_9ACTN|nr:hypothetical protein [Actinospica acidithermotolerans]MBR7827770.1 hypothetical protein [Actinospica acidithermotolerans]